MQIKEIAKKLNEQIIAEMQKGVVPWVCPWNKGFTNGKTVAVNGVSKRAYRSCNYFFMNYLANQYGENEFFTFSQIMKLGGKLKKDAQFNINVFYKKKQYAEAVAECNNLLLLLDPEERSYQRIRDLKIVLEKQISLRKKKRARR